MMEKVHEQEMRKLHSLLDEATEEPQYFDRAYVDEAYIDTESLWALVVDRAGDGYPDRIPDTPKTEEELREEQAGWGERQAEMIRIFKARSKRSVDEDPMEIISNLNSMMELNNPPGWFSDKVGLGDTSRYKFIEDNHLNAYDSDKYYFRPIEDEQRNLGKNREAKLNSLYVPLDEFGDEELTKQ